MQLDSFEKKFLLVIFAIALILRFAPPLLFGTPLVYDSFYHIGITDSIKTTGYIPLVNSTYDPTVYTYPPFYHVILASASIISGIPADVIVMFFLPFISVLTIFAFFILLRRMTDRFNALLGAFFVAVAPHILTAVFDSPENIVFFILPLVLLFLFMKKEKLAAFFMVCCFFFNYLSFIYFVIPLLIIFCRRKKFLLSFAVFFVPFLLFWLLFINTTILFNTGVVFGADFVSKNLAKSALAQALQLSVVVIPILIHSFRKLDNDILRYWFLFVVFSFVSLWSVFSSVLRPWEQPKFFMFGLIGLIAGVGKKSYWFKYFVVVLLAVAVIYSVQFSFQLSFTKVTSFDKQAIAWLDAREVNGTIIAEPAFSEAVANFSTLGPKLINGLPLENSSKLRAEGLMFLGDTNFQGVPKYISDFNLEYVFWNFEDGMTRSNKKYEYSSYFDKVYSISFYGNCLMSGPLSMGGAVCNQLQSGWYKVN